MWEPGGYRLAIGGGRDVYVGESAKEAWERRKVLKTLQFDELVTLVKFETVDEPSNTHANIALLDLDENVPRKFSTTRTFGLLDTGGWLMTQSIRGSVNREHLQTLDQGTLDYVKKAEIILQLSLLDGQLPALGDMVIICTNLAGNEVASLPVEEFETFQQFKGRLALRIKNLFTFVTPGGIALTVEDNGKLMKDVLAN